MDIKINNENLIKLMKTSYYIENLEKPLKSESSYKLQDLVDISNKLKVNLFDNNNKKKTKKQLYSEIYKILSSNIMLFKINNFFFYKLIII